MISTGCNQKNNEVINTLSESSSISSSKTGSKSAAYISSIPLFLFIFF